MPVPAPEGNMEVNKINRPETKTACGWYEKATEPYAGGLDADGMRTEKMQEPK